MRSDVVVSFVLHLVILVGGTLVSTAFLQAPPELQVIQVDLTQLAPPAPEPTPQPAVPEVEQPAPEETAPLPEPVPVPPPDPRFRPPIEADEAPPEDPQETEPVLRPPEPDLPRVPKPVEPEPEPEPVLEEDVDFLDPEDVAPRAKPEETSPKEASSPPATAPEPEELGAGASVQASSTEGVEDSYLRLVQQKIGRRWEVLPAYARGRSNVRAVVSFRIGADGSVSDPATAVSSGLGVFDRQALRAVLDASPLPRPPARFGSAGIQINFSFVYNP